MGGGSSQLTSRRRVIKIHPVQQIPDCSKLMVPGEINELRSSIESAERGIDFEEQSPPSPVQQRPDCSKLMVPEEINELRSSIKSAEKRIDFKKEQSPPSPVQQRPDGPKLTIPEEINGSGGRGRVRVDSNSSTSSCESFRTDRSKDGFISSTEVEDDAADDSDLRTESDWSKAYGPTFEEGRPFLLDSVESTASSVSFKSDLSKDLNPNFKGQSSLKVSLDNQHSASTESDGREGPTEEFRERKFSFEKMLQDSFRRLLRRVLKNNMET